MGAQYEANMQIHRGGGQEEEEESSSDSENSDENSNLIRTKEEDEDDEDDDDEDEEEEDEEEEVEAAQEDNDNDDNDDEEEEDDDDESSDEELNSKSIRKLEGEEESSNKRKKIQAKKKDGIRRGTVAPPPSRGQDHEGGNQKDDVLGGTIDIPAFALVTGLFEDPKDEMKTKIVLPLTRLPATLGRTHITSDRTFFGLGASKALSRNHCTISYRDITGGCLGQYADNNTTSATTTLVKSDDDDDDNDDDEDKMVYVPRSSNPSKNKSSSESNNKLISDNDDDDDDDSENDQASSSFHQNIIRPHNDKSSNEHTLPKTGFFAVQCNGKNKIFVNGRRVEQGQLALLQHGATLRIASYNLYFLLPEETNSTSKIKTIRVPNPQYEIYHHRKRKRAGETAAAAITTTPPHHPDASDEDNANLGTTNRPSKKIKPDIPLSSAARGGSSTTTASTTHNNTTHHHHHPPSKPSSGLGLSGIGAELEAQTIETLLARMTEAVASHHWDRKHQMIGSAIALRAVRDAAKSKKIRRIAERFGGVPRADLITWIEQSSKYSTWVKQMLGKLEFKSYQSNVSKALMRAGYQRMGTTGRHVKWILPEGVSTDEEMDDDSDDDDDNDDNNDDNKQKDQSNHNDDDAATAANNKDNNNDDDDEDDDDDDDSNEDEAPGQVGRADVSDSEEESDDEED